MTNLTETEAREQLIQAGRLLFQAGVMSHSGHGNMSVRLPGAERMLLTSGGLLTNLTQEQLMAMWKQGHSSQSRARSLACIRVSTA